MGTGMTHLLIHISWMTIFLIAGCLTAKYILTFHVRNLVEFLTSRNLVFYAWVLVLFVLRVYSNMHVGDAKHIAACGFTISQTVIFSLSCLSLSTGR